MNSFWLVFSCCVSVGRTSQKTQSLLTSLSLYASHVWCAVTQWWRWDKLVAPLSRVGGGPNIMHHLTTPTLRDALKASIPHRKELHWEYDPFRASSTLLFHVRVIICYVNKNTPIPHTLLARSHISRPGADVFFSAEGAWVRTSIMRWLFSGRPRSSIILP